MKLRLERFEYGSTYTIGKFYIDGVYHCFLWYSGHNDFDAHEAKFKKYAKIFCHIHNLNEDEF